VKSGTGVHDHVIDQPVAIGVFRQVERVAVAIVGRHVVPRKYAGYIAVRDAVGLAYGCPAHDFTDAHRILDAWQGYADEHEPCGCGLAGMTTWSGLRRDAQAVERALVRHETAVGRLTLSRTMLIERVDSKHVQQVLG